MFHAYYLEEGSSRLHVAEGPAHGPPMLLLHGVLRCWRDFFPLLAPLATRWQLHGLDFRGHGLSAPARQYRVVDYVSDALRALEQVTRPDEPAVVYGHSLGAMVALATAAEAPDRVRALILEDPPFETMGGRIRQTAFQSLFVGMRDALRAGREVSSLAARLAKIQVRNPETGVVTRLSDVRDAASLRFSASCLAMVDAAVLEPIVAGQWLDGYDFARLRSAPVCPTLILQADLGTGGMLTPHDASRLEDGLSDPVRVEFPGIGHLIHWQATQSLLAVVGNFLESLRQDERQNERRNADEER